MSKEEISSRLRDMGNGLHGLAADADYILAELEAARAERVKLVTTAPRVITAEQVEKAAKGMFLWDIEDHPEPKPTWELLTEEQRGIWRSGALATFRAAGFRVEGTND
jgi:hypothetical protein